MALCNNVSYKLGSYETRNKPINEILPDIELLIDAIIEEWNN